MKGKTPKFLDSPYLIGKPGDWHLKKGAPKEVVTEFEEFMKKKKMRQEIPKIIEFNNEDDI